MKTAVQMNLMQRLLLEFFWLLARLFAVMPYWFKYYVCENFLFLLLRYVFRYRMKVVMKNLENSFPEKSHEELVSIRNRFYRTLAEIAVDTINMAHMTPKKRSRILVVKELDKHVAATHGRDWITLTAHYGCWEYCSYWGFFEPTQMVMAVYHPLRSVIMEEMYRRLRHCKLAVTVPMKECLRYYLRNRETGIDGRTIAIGLIADQNPPKRPDSHWFRFLNQDTIFFDGGEKLALKCHLPVYFGRLERLRRGCYELSFDLIYDGQEEMAPYEITQRYVTLLEAQIRKTPELWMWSHRRWKHKRKDVDR